jgi:adenosine kinase
VKETPPIVVSGSIAIDRIMSFSGKYRDHLHPKKLDSLSISLFLETSKDSYGGVGANIAYSLALLGERPILLGSVGQEGLLYMERLAKVGVNIQYVHESELPTASFTVMTDSDQNQVAGFYPGAMLDCDKLTFAPWKDTPTIAVVAPHARSAMRRQVRECTQWGLILCYDIGQQVSNLPADDLREGVEAADILILNDYEMTVLAHKTGFSISDIKAQVPVVITTLGKKGSCIEGKQIPKAINVGVSRPVKIVDPTGAGDAFRSGFLYGYAHDWPLKTCAQAGAVSATFCIESEGSQTHHFTYDELAKRYESSFAESLPTKYKGAATWLTTKSRT